MRRVIPLACAFLLAVLSTGGSAQDRVLALKCVNKIGDNMHRAKNKTVVWTEHCTHEAACEDVEVRLGGDPRITWRDGSYCWVLNVAER